MVCITHKLRPKRKFLMAACKLLSWCCTAFFYVVDTRSFVNDNPGTFQTDQRIFVVDTEIGLKWNICTLTPLAHGRVPTDHCWVEGRQLVISRYQLSKVLFKQVWVFAWGPKSVSVKDNPQFLELFLHVVNHSDSYWAEAPADKFGFRNTIRSKVFFDFQGTSSQERAGLSRRFWY